jgi:hypothetical protein
MGELAEVKVIYESNCRKVVDTMRSNANSIERGEKGEVKAIVYVMLTVVDGVEQIQVFGLGETEYWHSLGILQGGVKKLSEML